MKKIGLIVLCVGLAVALGNPFGCAQQQAEEQPAGNWLLMVNHGPDKPYNQYTALVVAFLAKQLGKVDQVTIFYGSEGVRMAKKGVLASMPLDEAAKALIAGQVEGLSPGDLPDNLEQFARFLNESLGVNLFACATMCVMDEISQAPDDTANMVDFIAPAQLPQVAGALMAADKIIGF